MENISDRLRLARERAGFKTAKAAAESLGVKYVTYSSHEAGGRGIPRDAIMHYARRFRTSAGWLLTGKEDVQQQIRKIDGLRVEGETEAGNFRDISLFDDDPGNYKSIPVAKDSRFPDAHQYALLVSGDSMDRLVPSGAYVTCADWADTGLECKPGMVLHVERHQGHLIETTIKEYAEIDGKCYLWPRSTNAKHKPIELDGDEGTSIFIKGLVIGKWEPFTF